MKYLVNGSFQLVNGKQYKVELLFNKSHLYEKVIFQNFFFLLFFLFLIRWFYLRADMESTIDPAMVNY